VPTIPVFLYLDLDGSVPFLDWFDRLPERAKLHCRAKLKLLSREGYNLRRPVVENLGGGVWELRIKSERVNYRILYFFHGQRAVIVSHGIVKQQAQVPPKEIALALLRRRRFESRPDAHTFQE
jgi:phage-related protein